MTSAPGSRFYSAVLNIYDIERLSLGVYNLVDQDTNYKHELTKKINPKH